MKLIGMLDSPYVRRVAISLQLLGLRFEHLSLSVFRTFAQFQKINPVVKARAEKMGVEAIHGLGLDEKGRALQKFLAEKDLDPSQIIYVGNDFNDLPCFEIAGWAVAVGDAYPDVIRAADYVLSRPGGYGAIRELADLVLKNLAVGHA